MRQRAHGSLRLPRARHVAVYVVGIGLWLSGGLWLLFHYCVQHPGPFGPVPNPLEPWWLKLHGAFAFAAIWLFGLLWGIHILAGWSAGRRRGTGGLLMGALGCLIVSGYLLYYLGDETMRPLVSFVHWGIGLALPAVFAGHRLLEPRRAGRAASRQVPQPAFQHFAQPPLAGPGLCSSQSPQSEPR
jgi:hypothetical protein